MVSPAPTSTFQPPTPAKVAARIDGLDWTKGALIVCMVIYHAINYSAYRPWAFKFLGFLPTSFIMITGFLVGQVYTAKVGQEAPKIYLRLATRGLKLLALVTGLNIANLIAIEHGVEDGLWEFGARAQELFLTGNGRIGVFEILIPISYFLLIAPLFVWLHSLNRLVVPIVATGLFFLCTFMEIQGLVYKNFSFFSVGVLGMAIGVIPMTTIDSFARRIGRIAAIYGVYRVCSYLFEERYPVQTFGATASILLLYALWVRTDGTSGVGKQMITFGKYSLIGYIGQIAVLKILVAAIGGKPQTIFGVCLLTLAALTLTVAIIAVIHQLRERSNLANVLYKAVFA